MLFYKYDSAYKLAINSVPSKMQDRLNVAKVAYANLIKFNSASSLKGVPGKSAIKLSNAINADL